MEITARARAILRAVGDGRVEMTCSCEPDLIVDGCPVCDQFTAHRLATDGLIRPSVRGLVGERVRAVLTPRGQEALTAPRAVLA